METGNLTQWNSNGQGGGGLYNSGTWTAGASTDVAHGGSYSLKATISTPSTPTSAVRAFRWAEPRAHRDAYYSAWYYWPVADVLTGNPANGQFWMIMQFKSRTLDDLKNDPIFGVELANKSGGGLVPRIVWYGYFEGPHQGDPVSWKSYNPIVETPVPVGHWVHFEAFLHQSTGAAFDGQVTFWQDGVKIFDMTSVRTSYDNPNFDSWHADDEWSANNYSDGISPNPGTLYIDDAKIASDYVD